MEASCSNCEGLGWIYSEDNGDYGVRECACRKLRVLTAQLRQIPEQFRRVEFRTFIPQNEAQAHALQAMTTEPDKSYFIQGDYRAGKTHLLTAQYKHAIAQHRPAMMYTTADLMAELRAVEMNPGEYVSILRDRTRYSESFHLFWDDADKFKITDFKFQVLFDLIDTIWRRNLRLTVTSNKDIVALLESGLLHPAIVRRIEDLCQTVRVSV